jgi:hypothetical protein
VAVDGHRFLINGEPFRFTGFGKHEDFPVHGRGYDPAVMVHDSSCASSMRSPICSPGASSTGPAPTGAGSGRSCSARASRCCSPDQPREGRAGHADARAIRVAAGLVPAAFILAAIAAMTAYPLTEDKFREIVREVAERRASRRT